MALLIISTGMLGVVEIFSGKNELAPPDKKVSVPT